MNSEKILLELSEFPKEYKQSEAQKQTNLRLILAHSDEATSKLRKRFSLQRVMVGTASILAVFLACFFVLTNTDLLEQPQKEGEQSHQKPPKVITSEKAFHSDELEKVTGIILSDESGMRIGTVKDEKKVNTFTAILKSAKYFGDGEVKEPPSGETYHATININNGEGFIDIQLWPSEKEANMFEANTNTWWTVKGIDAFISANTKEQSLEYDEIIQIAKQKYPDVDWEVLAESAIISEETESGEQVLKVSGLTPEEQLRMLYMDPTNGVILEDKMISTEDGVDVAKEFFAKINEGDLDAAWEMIHPNAKTPSLKIDRETFDDYFTKNKPKLDKVESATWERGRKKFPVCMCGFYQAINLKVNFAGIGIQEFHVVRTNEDDEWKLFWSYETKQLE